MAMDREVFIGGPRERRRKGALGPRQAVVELACTNTALRRAARRIGQIYDEALAPTGLRSTQAALLAQMASPQEGKEHQWPTLQSLAERLAVSISALTHALRPLVRDGFVELLRDAHDGRTKHAALTALGEQRLQEAMVLWGDVNQRVEVVLGSSAAALRTLADDVTSPEFLQAYEERRALRA